MYVQRSFLFFCQQSWTHWLSGSMCWLSGLDQNGRNNTCSQQCAQIIGPVMLRPGWVPAKQPDGDVVHFDTVARYKCIKMVWQETEWPEMPVYGHDPAPTAAIAVQGLEGGCRTGIDTPVGIDKADGLFEVFQVNVGKVMVHLLKRLVVHVFTGHDLPLDNPVFAETTIPIPCHDGFSLRQMISFMQFLKHRGNSWNQTIKIVKCLLKYNYKYNCVVH